MKSIQQSGLVYFDEDLNQWVTDSYKMYQHFKLARHNNITRLVKTVISLKEKYSTKSTSLDIVPANLKSDTKVNMNGFKLTERGFQKVMFQMGVPRKEETALLLHQHQEDFLDAFHNMRTLITEDLIITPKNMTLLEAKELVDNGTLRLRRASFILTQKNWKPLKKDSDTMKRIQRVVEYTFNPADEMELFNIEQELKN